MNKELLIKRTIIFMVSFCIGLSISGLLLENKNLVFIGLISAIVLSMIYLKIILSSSKKEKFECYEIHRPNIPQHGCNKQCQECKDYQERVNNFNKK